MWSVLFLRSHFNGTSNDVEGTAPSYEVGDAVEGYNADTGDVDFYSNGVLVNSISGSDCSGAAYFKCQLSGSGGTGTAFNFGQQPFFVYDPPAGYTGLFPNLEAGQCAPPSVMPWIVLPH